MVLTFGLFLHHVESHRAVAPNNVRGERSRGSLVVFIATVRGQKQRYGVYYSAAIHTRINTYGNASKV